jgi:hypothetical protein
LIDYEFIGSLINGLDVIAEQQIASKSFLVTSRYEDMEIRARCEQLNLKIIPKSFSIHIPINWLNYSSKIPEIVFIDDDKNLTKAWRDTAELLEKNILTFNNVSEFILTIENYSEATRFYIDSDLGDCMKGEDLAKTLYEKGYRHLYLATGHEASKYENMYWIREVVGKAFPSE